MFQSPPTKYRSWNITMLFMGTSTISSDFPSLFLCLPVTVTPRPADHAFPARGIEAYRGISRHIEASRPSRHTSTNSMVPASNFSGAEPLGAKPSISDSWAERRTLDLRRICAEFCGGSGAETHGKLWKNHGKTWENHGKTYGKKR